MRFLFLDDNSDRHLAFEQIISGKTNVSVDYVWTVEEAIQAFSSNDQYDCVFLDHDLGGEEFVARVEGTGTEVAQFIAIDLPIEKRPRKVIVHSWNPQGASRMEKILLDAGISVQKQPFSFPR